ncbi:MAG: outer membrane protein transport protein [Burkholderiales bacterium]|nr:outer membrane protein transport protein [Burkholderiales bacterium]
MKRTVVASALLAMFAIPSLALATDGYFPHGYGMKSKGMGGASVARSDDAFGGANNPASMVWAGDRYDIGIDLFSPKRDISRSGSAAGIDGSVESGSNLFYIPEFGYNRMIGWDMSVGVSVYGNGGMNTDYDGGQISAASPVCGGFNAPSGETGPYNMLCGSGKLGMNLEQLIIAPTFAKKVNKDHSFGASLLIARQTFKAEGLSGFFGFTSAAFGGPPAYANSNLTNRGNDTTWGYGLKLGWMGRLSDTVTMGASYTSKVKMDKFEKYKDLFAGEGYFDMPSSITVGMSVKTSPKLTLAADLERIEYSGIKSIANPSTNVGNSSPLTGNTVGSLGCDSCRGFGWSSVNVIKIGAEYQYNPNLILRAGYNHTDNPIQGRDVTFNMIAPGVVRDHATLGFTYNLSPQSELTMAYMHAFKNSVEAPSLFNSFGVPAGTEKIQMYENSIGIAYSRKLK